MVIFYQDCSFEHWEVGLNKVLYEGKLGVVVTEVVRPVGVRGGERRGG